LKSCRCRNYHLQSEAAGWTTVAYGRIVLRILSDYTPAEGKLRYFTVNDRPSSSGKSLCKLDRGVYHLENRVIGVKRQFA
jgi:hypothetical protein